MELAQIVFATGGYVIATMLLILSYSRKGATRVVLALCGVAAATMQSALLFLLVRMFSWDSESRTGGLLIPVVVAALMSVFAIFGAKSDPPSRDTRKPDDPI